MGIAFKLLRQRYKIGDIVCIKDISGSYQGAILDMDEKEVALDDGGGGFFCINGEDIVSVENLSENKGNHDNTILSVSASSGDGVVYPHTQNNTQVLANSKNIKEEDSPIIVSKTDSSKSHKVNNLYNTTFQTYKVVGHLDLSELYIDNSLKHDKFPADGRIKQFNYDKDNPDKICGGFSTQEIGDRNVYFELSDIIDKELLEKIKNYKSKNRTGFINQYDLNYFIEYNSMNQARAKMIHRWTIKKLFEYIAPGSKEDFQLIAYTKQKIDSLIKYNKIDDCLKLIDIILNKIELQLDEQFENYLLQKKYELLKQMPNKSNEAKEAYRQFVENSILLPQMTDEKKAFLLSHFAEYLIDNDGQKEEIIYWIDRALKLAKGDQHITNLEKKALALPDTIYHNKKDIMISSNKNYYYSEIIDIDIQYYINQHNNMVRGENINELLVKARKSKFDKTEESYKKYLIVLSSIEKNHKEYRQIKAEYAIQKAFLSFSYILSNPNSSGIYFYSGYSYMLAAISLEPQIQDLTKIFNVFVKALFIVNKESFDKNIQWNEIIVKYANSPDKVKQKMIWSFLINVGTANSIIWNELVNMDSGIGDIYKSMDGPNKKTTYSLINELEGNNISSEQLPNIFLDNTFECKRNKIKKLTSLRPLLSNFELNSCSKIKEILEKELQKDLLFISERKEIYDKIIEILNSLEEIEIFTVREQITLLGNSQNELTRIMSYILDPYCSSYFGKVFFLPIVKQWDILLGKLVDDKKKGQLPLLEVSLESKFFKKIETYDKGFTLEIKNCGEYTASGYKLNIKMIAENSIETCENEIEKRNVFLRADDKEVVTETIKIPTLIAVSPVVNVTVEASALFGKQFVAPSITKFTLSEDPNKEQIIKNIKSIKWDYTHPTENDMFFGRSDLVNRLINHYLSDNREKTYVLYGLTRTGKTSILKKVEREIKNKNILINNKRMRILPFQLTLENGIENNDDNTMWKHFICNDIIKKFNAYTDEIHIPKIPKLEYNKNSYSYTDFTGVLKKIQDASIFPFISIDEFSYISVMLEKGEIGKSFVHNLRQMALENMACFLFAGTYEISNLIMTDSNASFSNTLDEHIAEISTKDAEELMDAMNDRLSFTKETKKCIHDLSGDIPYFIQIICRSCGIYATNRYRWIGIPELEDVVKILIGQKPPINDNPELKVLPRQRFMSNMLDPKNEKEHDILAYIAMQNGPNEKAKPISLCDIEVMWSKKYSAQTEPLYPIIDGLLQKKILKPSFIDNKTYYSITVDLFRRWYAVECMKTRLSN